MQPFFLWSVQATAATRGIFLRGDGSAEIRLHMDSLRQVINLVVRITICAFVHNVMRYLWKHQSPCSLGHYTGRIFAFCRVWIKPWQVIYVAVSSLMSRSFSRQKILLKTTRESREGDRVGSATRFSSWKDRQARAIHNTGIR
jgi:hypothetical protein